MKDMEAKTPNMEMKVPQPLQNKFAIEDLKNRINYLERKIRILEVLVNKFAVANGIKVETFQNGLVVISQIG